MSLKPQAILYSFPAVCWIYGAGFIFSTFVSVVFWGNPVMNAYQTLRNNSSTIRIKALKVGRFVQGGRQGLQGQAILWTRVADYQAHQ